MVNFKLLFRILSQAYNDCAYESKLKYAIETIYKVCFIFIFLDAYLVDGCQGDFDVSAYSVL